MSNPKLEIHQDFTKELVTRKKVFNSSQVVFILCRLCDKYVTPCPILAWRICNEDLGAWVHRLLALKEWCKRVMRSISRVLVCSGFTVHWQDPLICWLQAIRSKGPALTWFWVTTAMTARPNSPVWLAGWAGDSSSSNQKSQESHFRLNQFYMGKQVSLDYM